MWQKLTQHCKSTVVQLKKKKKVEFNIPVGEAEENQQRLECDQQFLKRVSACRRGRENVSLRR